MHDKQVEKQKDHHHHILSNSMLQLLELGLDIPQLKSKSLGMFKKNNKKQAKVRNKALQKNKKNFGKWSVEMSCESVMQLLG